MLFTKETIVKIYQNDLREEVYLRGPRKYVDASVRDYLNWANENNLMCMTSKNEVYIWATK